MHGGSRTRRMHLKASGLEGGPPVLLLHGGGVAGWMWDFLRRDLEPTYTVFVPDLPGHGRSRGERYVSHSHTVDQLARLLRERGIGQAAVVGFSLGAQLAIELASRHPELIAEVIVVSAQVKPIPFSAATLRALHVTAPLARRRWFATLQARELSIPPELLEEYISTSASIGRDTLVAVVGANLGFELPKEWPTFPGRVLVMAGQRERRVMRESAEEISAARPGSELQIVEGCAHGIPLQRPDWFSRRVSSWLAER
jgi:pimeloyl-ACP methyl ester carboxylesterase